MSEVETAVTTTAPATEKVVKRQLNQYSVATIYRKVLDAKGSKLDFARELAAALGENWETMDSDGRKKAKTRSEQKISLLRKGAEAHGKQFMPLSSVREPRFDPKLMDAFYATFPDAAPATPENPATMSNTETVGEGVATA